jgi:4-azaleucine resistance transporter AzlC
MWAETTGDDPFILRCTVLLQLYRPFPVFALGDGSFSPNFFIISQDITVDDRKIVKNESPLKAGFFDGLPIFFGYFPAAVAFGLGARFAGFTLFEGTLMSLIVFAGASQFLAVSLVAASAGLVEIAAAVFLLNLRHFLMSASLALRARIPLVLRFPVAFGVTDETFSLLSFSRRALTAPYILTVEATAYLGWVSGTVTGLLAGGVVPEKLELSLGIVLYALFMALLVPEVRRYWPFGLVALFAGGVHSALRGWGVLSPGWSIVLAIAAGATAGGFFLPATAFDSDLSVGEDRQEGEGVFGE